MNPVPMEHSTDPSNFPHDELSRLELRVARRADELAFLHGHQQARDFWLDAEREVLSRELENRAAS